MVLNSDCMATGSDGTVILNSSSTANRTSIIDNELHLTFSIPAGFNGMDGANGADGLPGEVTTAALTTAISGTSNNTNAIATLDTPFVDPDAESMRQAYNALVLALDFMCVIVVGASAYRLFLYYRF